MHKDLETRTSQHRRPYDVYRFSQSFSDGQKSLMSVWSLSSTHIVPAPVWAKPSSPGDLRLNTFNECHIITFGVSPYTRYLRIAVTPSAAHYAFAFLRLRASRVFRGGIYRLNPRNTFNQTQWKPRSSLQPSNFNWLRTCLVDTFYHRNRLSLLLHFLLSLPSS